MPLSRDIIAIVGVFMAEAAKKGEKRGEKAIYYFPFSHIIRGIARAGSSAQEERLTGDGIQFK